MKYARSRRKWNSSLGRNSKQKLKKRKLRLKISRKKKKFKINFFFVSFRFMERKVNIWVKDKVICRIYAGWKYFSVSIKIKLFFGCFLFMFALRKASKIVLVVRGKPFELVESSPTHTEREKESQADQQPSSEPLREPWRESLENEIAIFMIKCCKLKTKV